MKSAVEIRTLRGWEFSRFTDPARKSVRNILPVRSAHAYDLVADTLQGEELRAFQTVMFDYFIGNLFPENLDPQEMQSLWLEQWMTTSQNLSHEAYIARVSKKRTLGFLERWKPRAVFKWLEEEIQRKGRGELIAADLENCVYAFAAPGMHLRVIAGWEHPECPLVLTAELTSEVHGKLNYAPVNLGMGCYRMEWNFCNILTEKSAVQALHIFLDEVIQATRIVSSCDHEEC
jgi:hypothetical protein